jgi:hypothetical protein
VTIGTRKWPEKLTPAELGISKGSVRRLASDTA